MALAAAAVVSVSVSVAAGAPPPPSLCEGWPDPSRTTFVNTTNFVNADLPPLDAFRNGTITMVPSAQWEARKAEIARLLQQYMYGTLPTEVPTLLSTFRTAEIAVRGGIAFEATLVFGVVGGRNASFTIEIIRPMQPWPGATPTNKVRHPVFLTQANHRRWGIKGVARGYVAVIYPGADVSDQSGAFRTVFPSATWGTILARSYLASRALDFVLTMVFTFQDFNRVRQSGCHRQK